MKEWPEESTSIINVIIMKEGRKALMTCDVWLQVIEEMNSVKSFVCKKNKKKKILIWKINFSQISLIYIVIVEYIAEDNCIEIK